MNKIFKYIIIILIGILLIFVATKLLSNDNKPNNNNNNSNETNKNDDLYKNDLIEVQIISSSDESTTYKYKHYEYEIPNEIEFVPSELTFKLKSKTEKKWEANISLMYDDLKIFTKEPERIEYRLINKEYNIDEIKNVEINNHKYTIALCSIDTVNHVIAYIDTNIQYGYEIDIINNNEESGQEVLSIIDNIIHNAKHDDGTEKYKYYRME